MKVIIAGSRSIKDLSILEKAIQASGFNITEVVSGMARGIDRLGLDYARSHNLEEKHFPADWNTYGLSAGCLRNMSMAGYSDALIAIWDGHSKGTKHMIHCMKYLNKPVYVWNINISD